MKISKQIMNPMRIDVLNNLQKRGETNESGLSSMSNHKIEAIRLAIKRFGELDLIKYTGGGYFQISEKGVEYLTSLKTESKEKWIIEYLQERKSKGKLPFVDMLDEDFVNSYIDNFNPDGEFMAIGAIKCPELSSLLSSMYKRGMLIRYTHGVRSGLCQDGKFPKWVYSYELPR